MRLADTIVSPFDNTGVSEEDGGQDTNTAVAVEENVKLVGPLDLTWENVEAVLDEMRHFLIQDGGNVVINEIDGPVVRLELQVRYVLICLEGRKRNWKNIGTQARQMMVALF
jgi:lysyl-tRNA synthetase class 2